MLKYSSESSDSGDICLIKTLDYSYKMLTAETLLEEAESLVNNNSSCRDRKPEVIQKLLLANNSLMFLPNILTKFYNLRYLDLSNNGLKALPDFITKFPLVSFVAKNNFITNDCLPKSFLPWAYSLKIFNLGGNNLGHFPLQLLDVPCLKYLHLGGNEICDIPFSISRITGLVVLCLGGNKLKELPETLGTLFNLEVLILSDNNLERIPQSVANLKKLTTLQLHKNSIRTLPPQIISLKCLTELSLRENPLVVKFVNDMTHQPSSLLEMSAKVIKTSKIPYHDYSLPRTLTKYLDTAHHCVNPKCNGVYFNSRVEHVKFVDFCGKYRIPLMQYLCSSKCVSDESEPSTSSSYPDSSLLRKVLLG